MATGACGIDCGACRLKLRGLCMGCGAGTGALAGRKLEAQRSAFGQACPVLRCARDRGVDVCLRDCRRFPCPTFEHGPAPFSASFLRVQKGMRSLVRCPSMDLEGMSAWQAEEVAPETWQRLFYAHPQSVCRRAMASYCSEEEAYGLNLLEQAYRIYPFRRDVRKNGKRGSRAPDRYGSVSLGEALILLSYLLGAKDVPASGRWVTERDLPAGTTFFQGAHRLTCEEVLERCGSHPERLTKAARSLGGRPVEGGDAAVELPVLPRVPVRYILWREDEEFPARLTVAFDASVRAHLALDAVWALVHVVSNRLARAAAN